MAVKPIPDGYHTVTPYLTIDDPDAVMLFLKDAFGAQETYAMRDDNGKIRHAEAKIGDSMVMMGRAHDQWKSRPANFYIYVEDVDAVYKKAIAAGATSINEPETQFYGDRHGGVTDSQGNNWWIATHVEDVSSEELERRAKQQGQPKPAAETATSQS
jgi:PhnB protein